MSYSCGSAAIQKQASTIFGDSHMVRKSTPDLCHEILNPFPFFTYYTIVLESLKQQQHPWVTLVNLQQYRSKQAQSSGIHTWWRNKKPTPDPCHEILHHISNFHMLYNSFRVSKATAATINYSCVSAAIQKQTSTIFGNSHIVGGGTLPDHAMKSLIPFPIVPPLSISENMWPVIRLSSILTIPFCFWFGFP